MEWGIGLTALAVVVSICAGLIALFFAVLFLSMAGWTFYNLKEDGWNFPVFLIGVGLLVAPAVFGYIGYYLPRWVVLATIG